MLRNELARLHGYRNYADYALVDRMAGTPAAVAQAAGAGMGAGEGAGGDGTRCAAGDWRCAQARHTQIEPWDWRYYAEKVRKSASHDFDDAALKPYFAPRPDAGAPHSTARIGCSASASSTRPDLHAYHPTSGYSKSAATQRRG